MTQRLRIWFGRGEKAAELTNSDLLRVWREAIGEVQRVLGNDDCARPKLAVAASLPAGMTAESEVLDAFLEYGIAPSALRDWAPAALPEGISLVDVQEVGLGLPSLQSDIRWAEYTVRLGLPGRAESAEAAVSCFLARDSFPWEEVRDARTRRYDIRALVLDLFVTDEEPAGLKMRLRTDAVRMGRPEQVLEALGLGVPAAVRRSRLGLATKSQVLAAWRRSGRFTDN
jgi:radical SAM-linked protein